MEDENTFHIRVRISIGRDADVGGFSMILLLQIVPVIVCVLWVGVFRRLNECTVFEFALEKNRCSQRSWRLRLLK